MLWFSIILELGHWDRRNEERHTGQSRCDSRLREPRCFTVWSVYIMVPGPFLFESYALSVLTGFETRLPTRGASSAAMPGGISGLSGGMPTTPRTSLRVAFGYDDNQRAVRPHGYGDDHAHDPRWGRRLRRGRPPRGVPRHRYAQRRPGGQRDHGRGAHHDRRGEGAPDPGRARG